MHEEKIVCSNCGREYPFKKVIFRCERCSSSLEIRFNYPEIRKALTRQRLADRPFNQTRYLELYPVKSLVSMGEGGTPLTRSRNLEKELHLGFELWFKYEAQNPTGSFKDRGSSVELSRALQAQSVPNAATQKFSGVVCASTGNMGASVAAYAAVAGFPCTIFTPKDTAPVKLHQILAYGARLIQIPGDYTRAAQLAEQSYRFYNQYLLGDYLFRREGTKSISFEISEQLKSPDFIVTPIGNGTLISAAWKAFGEWKTLGFSRSLPKMVGIQANGCSPVTRAFKNRAKIKPFPSPHTIAVAIECGSPLDGDRALKSIQESRGFSESVTDKEILKARELLARREGLFAEPAGAVALAGLLKAKKQIPRGSRVVCLVTGHGLKTPRTPVRGRIEKAREGLDLKRIFK